MIPVVVAGAAGRMGSRVLALACEARDLEVVGALERPDHPLLGRDAGEAAGGGRCGVALSADAEAALAPGRVLVAFTTPEASLDHLRVAARRQARAVVGTTGFSPDQTEEIRSLARTIPVVLSPNMSVGVTLAFRLLSLMARTLGEEYDVEIVEIHHRMKRDAPSGTALRMAEVVAEALGRDLGAVGVYGRHGLVGERRAREIGIHALRGGDVIGEHTVVFATQGERLELTHRAHSRDTFARGALRAVRFVAGAVPGLYSMQDVLGL